MGELTIAETISLWQLVVTAGIGLLQCALIWVGLRQYADRKRRTQPATGQPGSGSHGPACGEYAGFGGDD